MRFYEEQMPGSWAPGYLQQRLGNTAGSVDAGYAPAGWTALTDPLRIVGATEDEMIAAGLATTSSRGTLIDVFRDPIVLPLRDGDQVLGFVGRRNPGRETDDHAGPKYLNTRNTAAYHKGSHLYGLSEGTIANPDAAPVLVEGPFDAHAVTAAADGRYVGVAPLGTALTPGHVHRLQGYARNRPVLVATDPDAAGHQAAKGAYWLLVDHGLDPRHVLLPDGTDPADLLQRHGPGALREALDEHQPLVHTLVDTLACRPGDSVERRVWAMKQAAALIAPLPTEQWPKLVARASTKSKPAEETALIAMIDAANDRTERPRRPLSNPTATNGANFTTYRNRGRRRQVQVPAIPPPSGTPPLSAFK